MATEFFKSINISHHSFKEVNELEERAHYLIVDAEFGDWELNKHFKLTLLKDNEVIIIHLPLVYNTIIRNEEDIKYFKNNFLMYRGKLCNCELEWITFFEDEKDLLR